MRLEDQNNTGKVLVEPPSPAELYWARARRPRDCRQDAGATKVERSLPPQKICHPGRSDALAEHGRRMPCPFRAARTSRSFSRAVLQRRRAQCDTNSEEQLKTILCRNPLPLYALIQFAAGNILELIRPPARPRDHNSINRIPLSQPKGNRQLRLR